MNVQIPWNVEDWPNSFAAHVRSAASTQSEECILCFTITLPAIEVDSLIHCFDRKDGPTAWFWQDGANGHWLFGTGPVVTCTAEGDNRWARLSEQMSAVESRLVASNRSAVRWMGGAAFDARPHAVPWRGWSNAMMVLPRFLVERVGGESRLTVCTEWAPGDSTDEIVEEVAREWEDLWREPDGATISQRLMDHFGPAVRFGSSAGASEDDWSFAVAQTAADIRAGRFGKVVLARCATHPRKDGVSLSAALHRLGTAYPDSYVFAIMHGQTCFLGATPERLVKVSGEEVMVDCLAGTIARGETPEEDKRLGSELLESVKDREEHAVVYRWLHASLEDVVDRWEAPPTPQLKKLRNVQHLYTPIRARRKGNWGALDMAARLHPTPAVAGVPREAAMDVIRERERMDRGWYAGFVGWQGLNGDGEYSVALRCALVEPHQVHLYAGGGIMGNSEPEREWNETRMKMRPMEAALGLDGEENGYGGE